MAKILLVEDEKVLRDAFEILLKAQGKYEVDVAANGQEALDYCAVSTYDVILLDLMMPVLDGVGFLQKAGLVTRSPATRVVIMSNLSSGDELARAMKLGAHRNEVKSDLAPSDILAVIKQELDTSL